MAIDFGIEDADAIFERALTRSAERVLKPGNGAAVSAPAADRDEAPPVNSAARKFPLLAFDQIKVDTQRRGYLVKGLLASTGLAVVWGPPKYGKSFWAVDVGMHIALGREYHGRRVQQAPVVYIALEGQHGLPARLEAFKRHHDVTEAPFYLILVRLDLISDVGVLITEIKAQIGAVMPGVVFIDTLNRSLVGSESKDEDMARYLGAADRLAGELGAAVVVVHHCGIDATRPRGHTSLTGSVESQLAVKRGEAGEVVVTVEYAKDFAEGAEVFSRLEPVMVGTDPDGDDITTLVVLPAAAPATTSERRPVRGAKAIALEILRKAIDEAGSMPPASNHIPTNTRTISIDTWRTYAYQGSITESDEPDSKRKAFVRAVKDLQAANLVGIWGEYAWLI
jgi:AAA domain